MHLATTWATARRILVQLRHDRPTAALILVLPALLIVLLRYVFDSAQAFDRVAPSLLGLFPFLVMFLVTSVTTLRERTTGTLERLMTMPIGRVDLLLGYALAFGLTAIAQVALVAGVSLLWLGLHVEGSVAMLMLVALLDALLGMALGLFVSAFARTEFQVVQFMPAVVMPQVLLCGLFSPRDQMTAALRWASDAMPLSYAVDSLSRVTASAELGSAVVADVAVVAGSAALALMLGAATLRRRTP